MEDSREFSTSYSGFPRHSVPPTRFRRRVRDTKRDDVGEQFEGEDSIDLSAVVQRKIEIDDSDDSSVDHNYDVESLAESIDESLTWRGRMQLALHSHWFHLVIVILVALDAFIVLFELLLDVGAFDNILCRGETKIEQAEFCHFDSRSRDVCAAPARVILKGQNISSMLGDDEIPGVDGLCSCKFREGKEICVDDGEDEGTIPANILHIASLIILSIFMLEVITKWIAFRLKYFTHKFEVFDGTIVVISWILDITSLKEEEAFEAASLLIILRLWRVVRIVNGAVLSAKAQSDAQLNDARNQARKIIHAFHKCQDTLDIAEEENEQMKKLLEQYKHKRRTKRGRGKEPLLHEEIHPPIILLEKGPEDDSDIDEFLDKLTAIGKGPHVETTETHAPEIKDPPEDKGSHQVQDPPEDKDKGSHQVQDPPEDKDPSGDKGVKDPPEDKGPPEGQDPPEDKGPPEVKDQKDTPQGEEQVTEC